MGSSWFFSRAYPFRIGQLTRCRLGLALGDREEEGDASAPQPVRERRWSMKPGVQILRITSNYLEYLAS